MSRPFIVLGDRTSHGGTVVEASASTDTHGRRIARVGDRVTCPRKGHGRLTTIATGDPTMLIDGKPVARHGDKCACGATLIASQSVSTVGPGGGGDTSAPWAGSSAASVSPPEPGAKAEPDKQDGQDEVIEQYFFLADEFGHPCEGYRYDLFANGALHAKAKDFSGGCTTSVQGVCELKLVIWLN
jgi:uncharacterized Zn-binding protein involved in type VI secretion